MNYKLLLAALLSGKALFAESLSVITVDGSQDTSSTSISGTKIDRTEIENSVQGNGFIGSLLETNPNIEVSDQSKNSKTAGEITPGKVSINDAPFYQNNFQIDGVSNDSLIDPNLSGTFNSYDAPGNENEIFLDLDLVESIEVYDSGISAEYGNFTGGVIDVKTIRAGAEPVYKVSYGHTSDKLTKFHVSNKEEFEKARSDKSQPRFEKHFYSAYASMPINDENGVIFSYNRKESIIPGAYFGGFRDKERLNQSLFFKWSHYFEDDAILDITGTHSPYNSTHFLEYVKDSNTKIKGGGYSLKANYEKGYDFWNLKSSLAYKYNQNSKKSLNYHKKWGYSDDKNWGLKNGSGNDYSIEGGSGTIEKENSGMAYNLKLFSDTIETSSLIHKLKTGFDINLNSAKFDREEDMHYYSNHEFNYNIDCNGDTQGCFYYEQFFTERRVYQAESTSVDMLSHSLFLEDKIEYKNFEITPGLRYDYNDYLKNHDYSYRVNSSIKPFKNNKTVVYGGFNRYYGKSFLGFKLREARIPYYDEYRKTHQNVVNDWGSSSDKDDGKYVFSDLKTPYSDESLIGLRKDFSNIRFNLKYVQREAKDKFSKKKDDYKIFTMPDGVTKDYYKPTFFTNEGRSESKNTTLNIGPVEPIRFQSFSMGYKFSTSWKETTKNITDYDDSAISEDSENDSNKVYYKGEFYDSNDLNIKSKPRTYNLHLNFAFQSFEFFGTSCRTNVNSIIKHKASYTDLGKADGDATTTYTSTLPNGKTEDIEVPIYGDIHFKAVTTLDLKATFNFKVTPKKNLILNTEVNNLFDKVYNVENSKSNYKTGRQLWFKVAYKF
ncbi:MAG: TonB-dependent receptor plug domain-containing protein [Campylobacterales bacterium]|nr:TonB-dependent receptor plug domain-containing protein [Campylobacterales bacterium]